MVRPRTRKADRAQMLLLPCSLEELISPEHPARTIVAAVSTLDLAAFYEADPGPCWRAGTRTGRPAADDFALAPGGGERCRQRATVGEAQGPVEATATRPRKRNMTQ